MSKVFNRFSHLMGVRMRAEKEKDPETDPSAAEADQDQNDPDAEEEEDGDKTGDSNDKKGKAKGKARGEEEDPDGEDDDPDADEGDDDTDAEDEEDEKTARARARERGRCAAIFSCPAAAGNLVQAAYLAFETSIPRGQAVRILKAGGGLKRRTASRQESRMARFDQRMARNQNQVSQIAPSRTQNPNMNPEAMAAASILKDATLTGRVKRSKA